MPTKTSTKPAFRKTRGGLLVLETGRIIPGTEPANPYTGRARHPWQWRPTRDEVEYFDSGWKAVRFIERYCRHTKGRWRGRPFVLLPFQLIVILELFGTLDRYGRRVFRTAYLEWARKNGKSELAAAIALYLLAADGENAPEVYGAAVDQDQANLVFAVAADMVTMEPHNALSRRLRVLDSRKRIIHRTNGGFYRTIPADEAGALGFNAHGVVFDEVLTQKTRDLWDALNDSTDAREQPLTFAITTAGTDPERLEGELHAYSLKVLAGDIVDPSWYTDIRALAMSADWLDELNWIVANPALGDEDRIAAGLAFKRLEGMREKAQKALDIPSYQNNFRRFHLNQRLGADVGLFAMDQWDRSGGQMYDREVYVDADATAGLDLAATTDLAAFVVVTECRCEREPHPEAVDVHCRFWLPKDGLEDRERSDQVPYSVWARDGFLTLTEGNIINYDTIAEDVGDDAENFMIQDVEFDRWGGQQLPGKLEEQGIEITPKAQTIVSLSAGTKETLRLVKAGRFHHFGNPILRWMASNTVGTFDDNENVKPNKKKSKGRIDGIVAGVMAVDARLGDDVGPSAYEDNDVEFV